ncbi:hypothetical protein AYO44_07580 [Planctomycetaceae bacterium SCGC AG-212-F19]|nr:hypothetical protein AYO44_07580 [Planctomycetaceae bacterium SCGC AG-212-F19]
MFGSGAIVSETGDIPQADRQNIKRVADAFYSLLMELVNQGRYSRLVIRLLRPINVGVLLGKTFVHFVFTNEGTGAIKQIKMNDLRRFEEIDLTEAIDLAEKQLGFQNAFGFSLPVALLSTNPLTPDTILPFVESYYRAELEREGAAARKVQIKPIFQARNVFVDPDLCFVLMPFGDEYKLQEIYTDQIVPAIKRAGFRHLRADAIYEPKPIMESVWESILKAKVIVAELTGRNPNVLYELGIAHCVGKDVILLSQTIDDVPFDLRHLRVILYELTPRGAKALEQQLEMSLTGLRQRG